MGIKSQVTNRIGTAKFGFITMVMALLSVMQGKRSAKSLGPEFQVAEEQVEGVPIVDQKSTFGQLSTVVTGLVIVVVGMVAVLIVDAINESLGNPSNGSLNSSKGALLDGFAGMMDLVGPLLLVLIAAVIIGVVQRFRQ